MAVQNLSLQDKMYFLPLEGKGDYFMPDNDYSYKNENTNF